jgi:hypothetical protein
LPMLQYDSILLDTLISDYGHQWLPFP